MASPSPVLLTALAAALTLLRPPAGSARAGDFATRQRRHARVATAWKARIAEVRREFRAAGATWPPRGLYLRAFKLEGTLEIWASAPGSTRRVAVKTVPICASSGILGPKVRQGDLQVPEGFYQIDRFNPGSSYHLSLGVSYPNAVDRARRRPAGASPGGDIFIHGRCVTVGCLPIEDGPIEWLYLAAVAARDAGQRRIPVHIFPCRFGSTACEAARASYGEDAETTALWTSLAQGYRAFERTRRPPRVTATMRGYAVRPLSAPEPAPPR